MTGPAGSVIAAGSYPLCITRIIYGYSGKIMSRNNFDVFFFKCANLNRKIHQLWQLEHCHLKSLEFFYVTVCVLLFVLSLRSSQRDARATRAARNLRSKA